MYLYMLHVFRKAGAAYGWCQWHSNIGRGPRYTYTFHNMLVINMLGFQHHMCVRHHAHRMHHAMHSMLMIHHASIDTWAMHVLCSMHLTHHIAAI